MKLKSRRQRVPDELVGPPVTDPPPQGPGAATDPRERFAGASDEIVLELRGVGKTYGSHPGVEALKSIDVAIRRGELLAIVGPSGSGKSTLLHIIGTLERPTAGSVWISGQNIEGMSDRRLSGLRGRNIGFVFQQFFLLEGMTAAENVAAGLIYQGVGQKERMRLAEEALGRVGMTQRREHRPSQLSGGERQRVAIARAIAGQPSIVLADEPTGNLDSVTGRDILNLLRRLNEEGATIAVITHDREMAAELPRRVELRDGSVIYDGAGDGTGGAFQRPHALQPPPAVQPQPSSNGTKLGARKTTRSTRLPKEVK